MDAFSNDGRYIVAIDKDGRIFEVSSGRKGQLVGIDRQREEELLAQISDMQAVIDNYYAKLVDLGEIIPPKSPDEIAKEAAEAQLELLKCQIGEQNRLSKAQQNEQSQINAALLDAVRGLTSKIESLEGKDAPSENKAANSRKTDAKGAVKK